MQNSKQNKFWDISNESKHHTSRETIVPWCCVWPSTERHQYYWVKALCYGQPHSFVSKSWFLYVWLKVRSSVLTARVGRCRSVKFKISTLYSEDTFRNLSYWWHHKFNSKQGWYHHSFSLFLPIRQPKISQISALPSNELPKVEILEIFGWHFGRNGDLINSIWI